MFYNFISMIFIFEDLSRLFLPNRKYSPKTLTTPLKICMTLGVNLWKIIKKRNDKIYINFVEISLKFVLASSSKTSEDNQIRKNIFVRKSCAVVFGILLQICIYIYTYKGFREYNFSKINALF